ncbi:hypothetical protein [Endozoicomonas ascidiicola]|uniref:hypothetical protein n=1 Tax=Endozoicomonas ascidiicola TaxID=1698521 RepID=UPI00082DDB8C|nr:hypothetical protein [Endozoicomonas ascidiicola]
MRIIVHDNPKVGYLHFKVMINSSLPENIRSVLRASGAFEEDNELEKTHTFISQLQKEKVAHKFTRALCERSCMISINSSNPLEDIKNKIPTDKEVIKSRISMTPSGISALKSYIDSLDKYDANGRALLRPSLNISKEIASYCSDFRENALLIINDYLERFPEDYLARNTKIFLLNRLEYSNELLEYCDQCLKGNRRIKHIENKRIEALLNLHMFHEALDQIEKTYQCFNDDFSRFCLMTRYHMYMGNWELAKITIRSVSSLCDKSNEKEMRTLNWFQKCCNNRNCSAPISSDDQ